jgi:hypothetical protein
MLSFVTYYKPFLIAGDVRRDGYAMCYGFNRLDD